MADNSPHVFSGVTPEQYAKLSEKARQNGIDIRGNSGSASKYGVEVAWNYSPETQQLSLECVRTPMFVSAATVYGRMDAMVKQALSEA